VREAVLRCTTCCAIRRSRLDRLRRILLVYLNRDASRSCGVLHFALKPGSAALGVLETVDEDCGLFTPPTRSIVLSSSGRRRGLMVAGAVSARARLLEQRAPAHMALAARSGGARHRPRMECLASVSGRTAREADRRLAPLSVSSMPDTRCCLSESAGRFCTSAAADDQPVARGASMLRIELRAALYRGAIPRRRSSTVPFELEAARRPSTSRIARRGVRRVPVVFDREHRRRPMR
jgi:hypothetical protein